MVHSPDGASPKLTLFAEPLATRVELMSALTHALLRRADHRVSDVRLDVGLPFRSTAWPRTSINPTRWTWKVAVVF
eukprot:1121440-Heterocapsa_arctica.AAC.1